MAIKELLSKTGSWVRNRKLNIHKNTGSASNITDKDAGARSQNLRNEELSASKLAITDKNSSLDAVQNAFGQLVEKLGGINAHLNRQINQHEELMGRIDKLPELLENYPAALENQKKVVDELIEQLKVGDFKDQRFIEAVEKIPAETVKQTGALTNISHQLSASADVDAQMSDGFNRFNSSLDKMAQNVASQTDGISQMSKTFAAGDRYLKYVIAKQNKRFMWTFFITTAVCFLAIAALVVALFMIKN